MSIRDYLDVIFDDIEGLIFIFFGFILIMALGCGGWFWF